MQFAWNQLFVRCTEGHFSKCFRFITWYYCNCESNVFTDITRFTFNTGTQSNIFHIATVIYLENKALSTKYNQVINVTLCLGTNSNLLKSSLMDHQKCHTMKLTWYGDSNACLYMICTPTTYLYMADFIHYIHVTTKACG